MSGEDVLSTLACELDPSALGVDEGGEDRRAEPASPARGKRGSGEGWKGVDERKAAENAAARSCAERAWRASTLGA